MGHVQISGGLHSDGKVQLLDKQGMVSEMQGRNLSCALSACCLAITSQ